MLAILDKVDEIIGFLTKSRHEEDFVDRLNYRATVSILLFCAVAIFAKDYGGDPLKCWGRAEWKESWIEYAHDYCFIESTYFLEMDDPKIPTQEHRRQEQLDYYQWVPFLLVLQAVTYLLPQFFWKSFNYCSGIQVGTVLAEASRAAKKDGFISDEKRDLIAKQIANALIIKSHGHGNICSGPSRMDGSLTFVYFLTKTMLLINSAVQFYFLGYFLGKNNPTFGWDAVDALTNGESWRDSGLFPRVTLCDFQVRGLRNQVEDYTVQCVLMGNMINEKIFIALWWWMLILDTVTAMNMIQWSFKVFCRSKRVDFTVKTLLPSEGLLYPSKGEKKLKKGDDITALKGVDEITSDESPIGSDGSSNCDYSEKSTTLNRSQTVESQDGDENRAKYAERVSNYQPYFPAFLGRDGVLIMDLIARNSNHLVASAVLGKIFEHFAVFAEKGDIQPERYY